MNKTRGLLLTAGFVLATAFTFSCSGDDNSGGEQGSGVSGEPVTYEGETYPTVVIGEQTWFAKNLNYNASGSKCYDNSPANCTKYGRLYDWATAMGLPADCNSNSCSSQIQDKHKGICPDGWHIPSSEDWIALSFYVVTDSDCFCCCEQSKLKAKSGWNNFNGTDQYGFAALPGGNGFSDGNYGYVGNYGFWWSSHEGGSGVEIVEMGTHEEIQWSNGSKVVSYSVRCIKD